MLWTTRSNKRVSVWKHFSLKANDRMHHSIMTSFSLLHDGREVICSDMMTVEGMLILHFASLTESSQRLQIRCWNTQIFLKCKRYTSVMSKTGRFESEVQLWTWTQSLSESYRLHFYSLFFNENLETSETVLFLTLSRVLDAVCDSFLHSNGVFGRVT